jgi:hypothetical protein
MSAPLSRRQGQLCPQAPLNLWYKERRAPDIPETGATVLQLRASLAARTGRDNDKGGRT